MGFSRIRFVLKRKRSYGVTYKLDFQVHFFPKKELQYRLYIHYTLYRLQYRRTLTHQCTLKKYSSAVRRDSRSLCFFFFSIELQMEIKTLLLCTLKLYIHSIVFQFSLLFTCTVYRHTNDKLITGITFYHFVQYVRRNKDGLLILFFVVYNIHPR